MSPAHLVPVLAALLQSSVADRALLTVLQVLVALALLGLGVLVAHLAVRAVRTEPGAIRLRDARLILAGAGVLFVVGFVDLVPVDGVPSGSLASLALGFAGVAYLLYTVRPALFATTDPDPERPLAADEDRRSRADRRGSR